MIDCTFENGNKASLRHVVVDILIVKDDKVLLVKRAEGYLEGGKYAIPGGYVDRDETLKEAAKREALEETGYTIEIESLFRTIDNPNRKGEDRQNISFVYLAKPIEKVSDHDHEITNTKWFELDNLPPESEIAFDHFESIALLRDNPSNPI